MPDQVLTFNQRRDITCPADQYDFLVNEVREGRMTEAVAGSNFSILLVRGVTDAMTQGHDEAQPVHDRLTTRRETPGEESHTYFGLGPLTDPYDREPGEPIMQVEFTSDRATLVNREKAAALNFVREDIMRDRTGKLAEQASGIGMTFPRARDKECVAFFNSGTTTTIYDGSNLFADTHAPVTGGTAVAANDNNGIGGGALTESTLEAALTVLAGWQNYNGDLADIMPEKLWCASNQRFEAARIMRSMFRVSDLDEGGVHARQGANIHQGSLEIVVWPRLTASTWGFTTNVHGFVYQVEFDLTVEREVANSGDSFWRHLAGAIKAIESRTFGVLDWRSLAKGN